MDRRRPPGSLTERVLLGTVEVAGPMVHGYVLDPEREGEALVVELMVEGLPHAILRADLFDATLASEGARYPYHGFRFILTDAMLQRAVTIEVRLANDGTLVGDALTLGGSSGSGAAALPAGSLVWRGGLTFGGWLAPPAGAETVLRGLVDENAVVEARPRGWATIEGPGAALTVPAFEFDLPARFADGRAHRLEVVTGNGETLAPGAVPFVAFADGLARFLASHADVAAERVRGEFFDRLIPQSLPFEALEDWRARFAVPAGPPLAQPVAVVMIGDDHLEDTLDSLQDQKDLWIAGVMSWRGERAEFDPADLVAFLETEAAECEVIVFAAGGTVFLPGALQALAQPLLGDDGEACAYGDIIVQREDDPRPVPLALPAFDRERMIEGGYAASFFALTRPAALSAGRAGANSLFRIIDAASGVAAGRGRVPLHVPGFFARVRASTGGRAGAALAEAARHLCGELDISARIEVLPAARLQPALHVRRRPAPCLVSVIILVRNDAADLKRCYAALKTQETTSDVEFIVVDNDSATAETADLLAEIASGGVQIVRVRGPRNVARSMNCGAAIASGAYLCFVDQHVAVTSPDALEEMLGRCASPGTGAVGGLLAWPSGVVCDGGLVLGFKEGVGKAFAGCTIDDPGHGDLLLTAREVSAVSGEFMMVGRDTFLAAGGMDEAVFPLFFGAVAFCLANAALGKRTVFTPHARAAWHGPAHEGPRSREVEARFARELDQLRSAWPHELVNDPHYSPLLNLDGRLYAGLAWPPRDLSPRRPLSARRASEGAAGEPERAPEAVGRRHLQGEHW